ncbi:MAG: hypothetical protein OQJ93_13825 [Ignavibacteriaceae bacterium]|nr:hypothetical protein [Ignavibacteriaceae bacterium]
MRNLILQNHKTGQKVSWLFNFFGMILQSIEPTSDFRDVVNIRIEISLICAITIKDFQFAPFTDIIGQSIIFNWYKTGDRWQ